jgi:hypothetical protein
MLLVLAIVSGCSTTTMPTPQAPTAAAAELAGRRAQIIGWLHDYRVAGVYPTDAAGQPLSVFVDAKGVRCPMAELIHKSGRDDLVAAVQREHNAVRLADVHAGPLYDWMLASGLTQEEVALVQGAMNIDFNFERGGEPSFQLAVETAEVRGKLEMAEAALNAATGTSLLTAVRRLPARDPVVLAATPIAGAVVPKTAMPSAAVAIQPMLRGLGGIRRKVYGAN